MKAFKRLLCAAVIGGGTLFATVSISSAAPFCSPGYHWGWTGGYFWDGHGWRKSYACVPRWGNPWDWMPN
jgi:hypothetical protein